MNRGIGVNGFIVNDGKFLLVKRADNDDFLPGVWEIPGGKLEIDESCEEGTAREVLEETGLEVEVVSIISNWEYEHDSRLRFLQLDFLCRAINQNVKLSEEHSDYAWITYSELDNYDISPEVKEDLLKIRTHPLVQQSLASLN